MLTFADLGARVRKAWAALRGDFSALEGGAIQIEADVETRFRPFSENARKDIEMALERLSALVAAALAAANALAAEHASDKAALDAANANAADLSAKLDAANASVTDLQGQLADLENQAISIVQPVADALGATPPADPTAAPADPAPAA